MLLIFTIHFLRLRCSLFLWPFESVLFLFLRKILKPQNCWNLQILSVCLLYEMSKEKKSFWYPYLFHIPRDYDLLATFGNFEKQALQVLCLLLLHFCVLFWFLNRLDLMLLDWDHVPFFSVDFKSKRWDFFHVLRLKMLFGLQKKPQPSVSLSGKKLVR